MINFYPYLLIKWLSLINEMEQDKHRIFQAEAFNNI